MASFQPSMLFGWIESEKAPRHQYKMSSMTDTSQEDILGFWLRWSYNFAAVYISTYPTRHFSSTVLNSQIAMWIDSSDSTSVLYYKRYLELAYYWSTWFFFLGSCHIFWRSKAIYPKSYISHQLWLWMDHGRIFNLHTLICTFVGVHIRYVTSPVATTC